MVLAGCSANSPNNSQPENKMDKTYLVDGQPVRAESARHAVKYYIAVLNRRADYVEEDGKQRAVLAVCEGSGLGIFCDDEADKHYHFDLEGIYWLTDEESVRMEALA